MQCPDCGTFYSKQQAFCITCGQILSDGNEPTKIGHYQLLERIGQGGMGTVYHGFDENLERDVAIKVLHRKLLGDLKQIERFRREARTHSQFQHPNIVAMLDVVDTESVMALVMELVRGCTLKEFLQERGVPSWGEIIAISEAIMAGLSAAHAHGVVHRDMKPSNIFLADDGGIKLMDFGLAKSKRPSEDITESGAAVGTYLYMAPEQIIGRDIDGRTDLYSFGIVLYRMCTGQLPFTSSGGGEFELMEKHVRHVPARPETLNSDIPPALSDLVMALLEKSPDDRPASCDVVIDRLHKIGKPQAPKLKRMSFSELHAKLDTTGRKEPAKGGGTRTGTMPSATEDHEETPQHSMLWAFRHSPQAPKEMPLDLRSPPPIDRETLQKLKASIASIPLLPDSWYQIERVLDDPESAPSDLAAQIDEEPELKAHILRLANSPAYAMQGQKVSNVAIAIARIGMGNIRDYLLKKMVPDFAGLADTGGAIDLRQEVHQLWFHNQAVALLSRELCDFSAIVAGKAASMFGMLHDIGKLVILHTEDDETLQRLKVAISAGSPSLRAEWDVLGYTHIDAGMMLALHWRLPRTIHRFIYFHHHPEWHTADVWPVDMQPAIMLNHMAHLLVQEFEDEDGDQLDTIWHPAKRSHLDSTEGLLRQPLRLPLKDTASYARLKQELGRIRDAYRMLYTSS